MQCPNKINKKVLIVISTAMVIFQLGYLIGVSSEIGDADVLLFGLVKYLRGRRPNVAN